MAFQSYPEYTEEFATLLDEIHQKTGTGFNEGDAIRWNFGKFLVSKITQLLPSLSKYDICLYHPEIQ